MSRCECCGGSVEPEMMTASRVAGVESVQCAGCWLEDLDLSDCEPSPMDHRVDGWQALAPTVRDPAATLALALDALTWLSRTP